MPTNIAKRHALTAAALIAVAGCLTGCGRSDDHAIKTAAAELEKLTGGGQRSFPIVSKRREVLLGVIKSLGLIEGGSESTASSAASLTARAQGALAEMSATDLVDAERRVQGRLTGVRASLGIWTSQNARAAQSESYKPDADLAAIDAQASEIEKAIGAAAEAERTSTAKMTGLQREAEGLLTQSRTKRGEAAAIRQQMGTVSQTEGLALMERAAVIGRDADRLDVQAADITAQAGQVRPAIDDAKRATDLLSNRRESLKTSRATVQARAQGGQAAAVEARRLAGTAAADVTKAMSDAMALRAGDVASAGDAAAKGYRTAISTAKKAQQGAQGEMRTNAALAAAGFSQALGDVLFVQARGLESFATVAESAASAKPALPDAPKFAQSASEAREAVKRVAEEAASAYKDAREWYDAAGGKPEVKERITKLIETLNRVSKGEAKLAADPAEADPNAAVPAEKPTSDPAPAGGDAPADPAAETALVKKMFGEFTGAIKAGRVDEALGFILAETDEAQATVDAVVTPMFQLVALDAACKEKLGAGLAEIMQASPMGLMVGPLMKGGEAISTFKAAETKVEFLSATKAEVSSTVDQKGPPTQVVKKGDRWLLTVPAEMASAAKGPAVAMMANLGSAAGTLAADVRAGKVTKEQVAQNLMMKLMPPGMPKPPTAPPGGG